MAGLDIGRTFSRMSGLVGRSLGSVGVFVLAVHVVSMVWQYFARQHLADVMVAARPTPGNPAAGLAIFSAGWYWASIVLSTVVGAFSMAGGIGGMVRLARGEATSLGDCARLGLQKLLPVLGFSLLWGLALGLGLILLVVPALILLTMWSVGLPVLLSSDTGVFAAFGRSRALTKGSRWKIFLVLLIVAILFYAVMFMLLGAAGISLLSQPGAAAQSLQAGASSPIMVLGSTVIGTLGALMIDALLVSIHAELDDGAGGQLADVFS